MSTMIAGLGAKPAIIAVMITQIIFSSFLPE